MVFIRAFGKFLQRNGHFTLKMHSDYRDSDVRDGFIGAQWHEARDCTLDANVQNRKLHKSILSTLAAPQTAISRCPDAARHQVRTSTAHEGVFISNCKYLLQSTFYSPFAMTECSHRRFHWQRGLRRDWAAARLLALRVRNPPGVCMSVSYKCRMLSGRCLCDGAIPHPNEFYRVCITECDKVQQWPSTPTASR